MFGYTFARQHVGRSRGPTIQLYFIFVILYFSDALSGDHVIASLRCHLAFSHLDAFIRAILQFCNNIFRIFRLFLDFIICGATFAESICGVQSLRLYSTSAAGIRRPCFIFLHFSKFSPFSKTRETLLNFFAA